jgi:F-type H+-transporting ATPase subunit alpha
MTFFFAGCNGYLDDIPVDQCRDFEMGLYAYVDSMNPGMFQAIETRKALDDQIKADMNKTIKDYKDRFMAEKQNALAAAK